MQTVTVRPREPSITDSTEQLLPPFSLAVISVLFFLSAAVIVPEVSADDSIRYTADVTRLPVGTDIAAMGDIGVALPRRAVSAVWNPAAAALLEQYEVSMEGADLYQHLSQHGCFAGAVPLKNRLGAVLSYQPFYSGRINLYDTIPEATGFNGLTVHSPRGFMRNYHHLVNLSFAGYYPLQFPRVAGTNLPIPIDLSAGINMKVYAQTMMPGGQMYLGMGYNADVGLLARIGIDYDIATNMHHRQLCVGATLRDVLPSSVIWMSYSDKQLYYSPERYREPFHFAQYYGVTYIDQSGALFADWVLGIGLIKEYEVTYHGGIEATFWDMASFRAGISGKTPTVGAGFRYRRLFIDYAFRFEEIAFSVVRLTIGVVLPVLGVPAGE
ncbi:MAG: hypothetical protein JW863_19220 [Chitinispirillaceae bacterium]|nr:hypothetical protein [Chitinispirillaceae bacterium]